MHGHNANEFWIKHEGYCGAGFFDQDFKNLISLMLSYYPQNRPTLVDIIGHPWLLKHTADSAHVIEEMNVRHQ